jgi:zinc/manganese transport system substrate-binding protein
MTSPFRRHLLVSTSLLCAAAALAACSGSDATDSGAAGAGVVASTSVWADVVAHVACDAVEVPALVPIGTDSHSFEPSVQDADTLREAQLVVVNGLGLEEGLTDALHTASEDGATVLELGPELDPLAADGHAADADHADDEGDAADDDHAADEHADEESGHDHGDTDPHVWMDPDRVATAVPLIAAALTEVDGLDLTTEEIDGCAADYVTELGELSAEIERTVAVVPPERRSLVTNHEALGYFADRFDFEVVGAVIPSTSSLGEANPRELDELAATMRSAGVSAIFADTTSPTKLADSLAEQVGSQVAVVELFTESLGGPDSGAASYVEMLHTDASRIADALAVGTSGTAGSSAPGQ